MSVRCDPCLSYHPNSTAYEVHCSSRGHREAVQAQTRWTPSNHWQDAERAVPCDACEVFLQNSTAYQIHTSTQQHRVAVAKLPRKATQTASGTSGNRAGDPQRKTGYNVHGCLICSVAFDDAASYKVHLSTQGHRDVMAGLSGGDLNHANYGASSSVPLQREDSRCSDCNKDIPSDTFQIHLSECKASPTSASSNIRTSVREPDELKCEHYGIDVSDKDSGVDFGTVDTFSLDSLPTIVRNLTVQKTGRVGQVALYDVRISSRTVSGYKSESSSFTASVGQVHWIQPGQPIRVDVAFTPTREGPHVDSVTLIFRDNEKNGWFTAKRTLKGTVVVNNRRQGATTPSRPPSPVVNRSPKMRRESVNKGVSSPSNSPRMRRESVFPEHVMQDRASNTSGSSEPSPRWHPVDERVRHDDFGANSMSTPTASTSTQRQRPSSFYPSTPRERYSPATSPAARPLRTPTPSLPLPLPQNLAGLDRGATDEDDSMGAISTEEKKLISMIDAELSRVQTTLVPSIEVHLASLRSPSPFPSPGRATSGTTSTPQRRTHMHLDDQLQRSIIYFDGILPEQGWMYARRRRKEAIKEVQAWVEVLEEGWAARRE